MQLLALSQGCRCNVVFLIEAYLVDTVLLLIRTSSCRNTFRSTADASAAVSFTYNTLEGWSSLTNQYSHNVQLILFLMGWFLRMCEKTSRSTCIDITYLRCCLGPCGWLDEECFLCNLPQRSLPGVAFQLNLQRCRNFWRCRFPKM